MRAVVFVVPLLTVALFASTVLAQGGGRGRGRPEEITNRVGAFFATATGPRPAGDQAGDLAQADLVRAASGVGQLTLLYLYDSRDDADVREQFERTLFAGDELGISLRCFHCGRIDVEQDAKLKAKFGKQVPLFVAFDKDGKAGEPVSMSGYKPSAAALQKQLEKVAHGALKPALPAFVKEYGGLVRDLEQLLNKKKQAQEKMARAGGDKQKRAEAEQDVKDVDAEVTKLAAKEVELLNRVGLPERAANATRLGGRGWGGGRGGEGGGRGGEGGGRGGEGGGRGGERGNGGG
jgi:hypothetical protein